MGFESFKPDLKKLPTGINIIGSGSIGGKAKGLYFVSEKREDWKTKFDSLIELPPAYVILTDVFDEFVKDNQLQSVIQSEETDKIQNEFLKGKFKERIRSEFKKALKIFKWLFLSRE